MKTPRSKIRKSNPSRKRSRIQSSLPKNIDTPPDMNNSKQPTTKKHPTQRENKLKDNISHGNTNTVEMSDQSRNYMIHLKRNPKQNTKKIAAAQKVIDSLKHCCLNQISGHLVKKYFVLEGMFLAFFRRGFYLQQKNRSQGRKSVPNKRRNQYPRRFTDVGLLARRIS
jgi:hypothetical protein